MKKIIFLSGMFVAMTASAQFRYEDFKPLHDLEASWEMKTRRGAVIEQWTKANDSLLLGKGFLVVDKDTVPQETVELRYSNGVITYTPSVREQNSGLPVTFTLVSVTDGKYVFENREHDFPQVISYQVGDRTLRASIGGSTKEGYQEIPYNFVKQ